MLFRGNNLQSIRARGGGLVLSLGRTRERFMKTNGRLN